MPYEFKLKKCRMKTSMKWTLIISVFTIIECLAERLEDNVVHLDLRNGVVRGFSNHISFIHKPTTRPGRSCDKQVVLKLDFSGPYKEAKILLDYAEPPRLWTLDISDSPTGDGYGGDNGSTSNMAETQIHNKQFRIYGNNLPGHMDASANGGLLITTVDNFIRRGSTAKISISDERVEWKSGPHKDNIKSRFLYTLRGQQPLYGTVDYNVYVGLNRVVAGNFRSGSGLCSATIALQSSGLCGGSREDMLPPRHGQLIWGCVLVIIMLLAVTGVESRKKKKQKQRS
ncbi:uncharacterized protein LOC110452627, partial [Mizuhopecten yessoensis]|uniref:uncharacterized protein LOC110452627 n=1 Tax=Mizuhopecten yessoensis TaxID=6573 RepID=UPI000B45875C